MAQAAYDKGYNAPVNATNPYSFNSGRRSFTAWAKGHEARWNERLPALLAWLDASA